MSLLPFFQPMLPAPAPTELLDPNRIDQAKGYSPEVGNLLELGGSYVGDLNNNDPVLAAAATEYAGKVQRVAEVEEIERALSEQIALDERELKARSSIHSKLAKHKEFLAKNHIGLQETNQSHLLNMAGLSQQRQAVEAKFTGIRSARSRIYDRMRGEP